MKGKKILSIETSSELCSAAISFDFNKFDERNLMLKHIHSERLIPVLDELLASNNIEASELDAVAVSMGPGSFTGLRIGLTAAKGIAFASELPIVPVPTFDAFALEISSYLNENSPFFIVNNANTEECYFAEYIVQDGNFKQIRKVSLEKKKDLSEKIQGNFSIFGNLAGFPGIKPLGSPRASYVAKWTYLFGEDLLTYNFDYLEPNYLKDFKIRKSK